MDRQTDIARKLIAELEDKVAALAAEVERLRQHKYTPQEIESIKADVEMLQIKFKQDLFNQVVAENERLRNAGEWQPIETAPLFVESMFVCEGLVGVSFGFKSKNGWAINADTDKYAPTHWMPLPATPAAKEGRDGK